MNYIGETAGLLTSVFFSMTALVFTRASRQVGAMVTNRIRLVIALIYLMIINLVLFGQALPFSAEPNRWWWLGISGVIGLALGDMFLFSAFRHIGARLGTLLMSLAPVIGAIIAWIFFGETLRLLQMTGILITLTGIFWVIASHRENGEHQRADKTGIFLGVLAAIGQAVGLVLSKQGMSGDFSPFAGNVIRMLAASTLFWLMTFAQREGGKTIEAVKKNPKALGLLALGALVGPVLGVSASLLAVQHAEVGVASTLMALPPVLLLPVDYFIFKERFGWQAVAGTFLAIAGVALLFVA